MSLIVTTSAQLIRAYNIAGITAKQPGGNPYDGKIDQTITRDKELYRSSLGTPVFTDLTLKGGTYTDNNGRSVTFEDMVFVTVLMFVSQGKNIVKTKIQGRNGTVKEYIGDDDYQVTINGIITGKNGSYPVDDVAKLKAICNAPIAFDVVSTYLQNLDVYSLVIESYAFDQQPGGYSQQNFTLNCISDQPVELQIT